MSPNKDSIMIATIKILLRNKPNKNGLYPVILKVIKNRRIKIITLGLNCKEKDWDFENSKFKRTHKNYIQRNRVLLKLEEKALKIIDDYKIEDLDFTLTQFESKFRNKPTTKLTLFEFWNERIEEFNLSGRTGSAKVSIETLNSFKKFNNNSGLTLRDITPELLSKYELFMRSNGSNDGGIGVRMREVRALFNSAINRGLIEQKYYPFKMYKVSKLKGKSIKRALSREDVKRIESLDLKFQPHLIDARNYFIFSYYTRGMNFYDMMKLQWDNIHNERILYIRSKTKGRFSIKILEPIREILNYYKSQKRDTNYVFPILLKDKMTPNQIQNRKGKTLKKYNKLLKEIGVLINSELSISSYTARHSFATNLKYEGISTDIIGELLGHNDVKVTQSYLKEFEDDVIDEAVNKLLEEAEICYS